MLNSHSNVCMSVGVWVGVGGWVQVLVWVGVGGCCLGGMLGG